MILRASLSSRSFSNKKNLISSSLWTYSMKSFAILDILFLISKILLFKNVKWVPTFYISSMRRQAAFTTFRVRTNIFPLLESNTRYSTNSRNLEAYSNVIFAINLFNKKHFASSIPFALENEFTKRLIILSLSVFKFKKYSL